MEIKLSPEDQELRPCYLKVRSRHNTQDGGSYYDVHKKINKKEVRVSRIVVSRVLGRSLLHTEYVDHIDGDTCNLQRSNLRVASSLTNMGNRRSYRGSSKYKGVYYNKERSHKLNPWTAQFSLVGIDKPIRLNLGSFITEEEGAKAYNAIALEWYGQYACINNIQP